MSHIWVPKFKILEAELTAPNFTFTGEYALKVHKADTGALVRSRGPFKNLFLTSGLDILGSWNGASAYVGTGTTPPVISDTQLQTVLGRSSVIQGNSVEAAGGAPDYWSTSAQTWRFNPGVATGNITEVGVGAGASTSSYTLMSRALVVDASSAPTAITVLADEYLDVTYQLKMYPSLTDNAQVVNLSGVPYTFTSRQLQIASSSIKINLSSGSIGSIRPFFAVSNSNLVAYLTGTAPGTPVALNTITATTMLNEGGSYSYTGGSAQAYVPGSNKVTYNQSLGLNDANLANGISGFRFYFSPSYNNSNILGGAFQTIISPTLMKDNTKVFSFGMSLGWGLHS